MLLYMIAIGPRADLEIKRVERFGPFLTSYPEGFHFVTGSPRRPPANNLNGKARKHKEIHAEKEDKTLVKTSYYTFYEV